MTAAIDRVGGHRLGVLTVSIVQPGSHPAGTILLYTGEHLVARGTLVKHGDYGTVILKWAKPSSRTASYTVRFLSSAGAPTITKQITVR